MSIKGFVYVPCLNHQPKVLTWPLHNNVHSSTQEVFNHSKTSSQPKVQSLKSAIDGHLMQRPLQQCSLQLNKLPLPMPVQCLRPLLALMMPFLYSCTLTFINLTKPQQKVRPSKAQLSSTCPFNDVIDKGTRQSFNVPRQPFIVQLIHCTAQQTFMYQS